MAVTTMNEIINASIFAGISDKNIPVYIKTENDEKLHCVSILINNPVTEPEVVLYAKKD